jgi:hypothetical protein
VTGRARPSGHLGVIALGHGDLDNLVRHLEGDRSWHFDHAQVQRIGMLN